MFEAIIAVILGICALVMIYSSSERVSVIHSGLLTLIMCSYFLYEKLYVLAICMGVIDLVLLIVNGTSQINYYKDNDKVMFENKKLIVKVISMIAVSAFCGVLYVVVSKPELIAIEMESSTDLIRGSSLYRLAFVTIIIIFTIFRRNERWKR